MLVKVPVLMPVPSLVGNEENEVDSKSSDSN